MTYFGALALLHRTFAAAPLATRIHVLGRYLTCPFLRTLGACAGRSRILDVGAGHGTFARLAVANGAARVVALEPDLGKILPSYRHPAVSFVAGFDGAVGGTFDAVTLFDVVYRVPREQWDDLFASAYARLRPGGLILIKELDPENRLKAAWNKFQEAISDRFLKLTLGDRFAYEDREHMRLRLERAGFADFESLPIGAFYPHAHIMYLASRPPAAASTPDQRSVRRDAAPVPQ